MKGNIKYLNLPKDKKIYFASDFHLGAPSSIASIDREKKVVSWLDSIKEDAGHVFILGDIFDFWFEYKYTIPKGFTRLLGKFMQLRDEEIPITFFTGNHDMWMFGYFENEFGIPIYRHPVQFIINDKIFLIGHGDGLGPGDNTYKLIKKIFENKFSQWLFSWIHPNIGFGLANFWSRKSREKNLIKDRENHGEQEWLIQYCSDIEAGNHHDYYVFGHRHLPMQFDINLSSRYCNIGDWINHFTYGVYDGQTFTIKEFSL